MLNERQTQDGEQKENTSTLRRPSEGRLILTALGRHGATRRDKALTTPSTGMHIQAQMQKEPRNFQGESIATEVLRSKPEKEKKAHGAGRPWLRLQHSFLHEAKTKIKCYRYLEI